MQYEYKLNEIMSYRQLFDSVTIAAAGQIKILITI
jgi:hypothetical protein